jgi:AcrR family transcriptional regulator
MKLRLIEARTGISCEPVPGADQSVTGPVLGLAAKFSNGPRRRNAAATRDAILAAARHRFLHASYELVGLREIAADAAVDPSLVSRYFGSKKHLFLAVVEDLGDCSEFTTESRGNFGARAARQLFGDESNGVQMAWIGLMVQAADILRHAAAERFFKPLAEWIGGAAAEPKANLIASLLMGLSLFVRLRACLARRRKPICFSRCSRSKFRESLMPRGG